MKVLALALLLAAAARDERAAVPVAEQAAVAMATTRGALIYAYDQAAWHGTDDMLAKVREPATKVAGYIADGPAASPRLIFYDRQSTPHAFYVAQFRDGRLQSGRVLGPDEDRALSPANLQRLKALAAANIAVRQAGVRPCGSSSFNTVVLPVDPVSGVVRVYYLTPQSDRAHLPFGGHYAVDVAPDGTAGTPHAFSRSCLEMLVQPPARANGATAVGVTITHLLDPVPTEIHVFSSLAIRLPIFVLTTTPTPRLWIVERGRVSGPRPVPVR